MDEKSKFRKYSPLINSNLTFFQHNRSHFTNNFAAIDFETGNNERTSVCSVIRLAPRNNLSHQRNQPALARYRFGLGGKRITKFQIRFQMSSNRWAVLILPINAMLIYSGISINADVQPRLFFRTFMLNLGNQHRMPLSKKQDLIKILPITAKLLPLQRF